MKEGKAGVLSNRAAGALVVLYFFAIAVLLLSQAMNGADHDEDVYMLGARFFAGHAIYKDYLYLQPPYHAVLLGSVYQLSTDLFGICKRPCYFLEARLLNWLVALGVMTVFYLLLRTMFERGVAIVCCTLLAFNPGFYAASGVVRNDLLPLLLSLLALFVLFRPVETGTSRMGRALVAGICVALAVGTKLNYIHMPPALFLFLALWPPQLTFAERLRRQVIPFSIGVLIGFAPIALLAARDPAAFYFGVFGFHASPPAEWLAEHLPGYTPLQTFWRVLIRPLTSVLVSLVVLLALLIGLDRSGGRPVAYFYRNGQWLFFFVLVAATLVGFLPSPSYIWYFMPAAPFLILCFVSLWSYPMRKGLAQPVTLVIFVMLASLIPAFVTMASRSIPHLTSPSKWQPVIVHAVSARVDKILNKANVRGKIATLSPSKIIDSRRNFYLELATAWGLFPRAAFMLDDEVRRLHGASPATLTAILEADMPAAIFGGYESDDVFLFAFAKAHGYRRVRHKALEHGILFVRRPQVSTGP